MKIGLATSGLWKLKDAIELMTGGTVCRSWPLGSNVDAIAGWGHKPTSDKARQIARSRNIPYIAFEDGFLRSVFPGDAEKPLSLVMDRTGIYYDARQPSDLEAFIKRRASFNMPTNPIREAMGLLHEKRVSKYNNFTISDISSLKLKSSDRRDRVLVVDQTAGDASIEGALATDVTFNTMLETAISENPGAEVLVRVHPETIAGTKGGHFDPKTFTSLANKHPHVKRAFEGGRIRLTPEPINPWSLLEECVKVYCVSSQLGFEGLIAGCEVHCFGMPFYGGRGLTIDHLNYVNGKRTVTTLENLFSAIYFDYMYYIDQLNNKEKSIENVIEILSTKSCKGIL